MLSSHNSSNVTGTATREHQKCDWDIKCVWASFIKLHQQGQQNGPKVGPEMTARGVTSETERKTRGGVKLEGTSTPTAVDAVTASNVAVEHQPSQHRESPSLKISYNKVSNNNRPVIDSRTKTGWASPGLGAPMHSRKMTFLVAWRRWTLILFAPNLSSRNENMESLDVNADTILQGSKSQVKLPLTRERSCHSSQVRQSYNSEFGVT